MATFLGFSEHPTFVAKIHIFPGAKKKEREKEIPPPPSGSPPATSFFSLAPPLLLFLCAARASATVLFLSRSSRAPRLLVPVSDSPVYLQQASRRRSGLARFLRLVTVACWPLSRKWRKSRDRGTCGTTCEGTLKTKRYTPGFTSAKQKGEYTKMGKRKDEFCPRKQALSAYAREVVYHDLRCIGRHER